MAQCIRTTPGRLITLVGKALKVSNIQRLIDHVNHSMGWSLHPSGFSSTCTWHLFYHIKTTENRRAEILMNIDQVCSTFACQLSGTIQCDSFLLIHRLCDCLSRLSVESRLVKLNVSMKSNDTVNGWNPANQFIGSSVVYPAIDRGKKHPRFLNHQQYWNMPCQMNPSWWLLRIVSVCDFLNSSPLLSWDLKMQLHPETLKFELGNGPSDVRLTRPSPPHHWFSVKMHTLLMSFFFIFMCFMFVCLGAADRFRPSNSGGTSMGFWSCGGHQCWAYLICITSGTVVRWDQWGDPLHYTKPKKSEIRSQTET